MLKTRFYPRGNALTEPVPFTDPEGAEWLVYIEGLPLHRPKSAWRSQTRLPERRLRFDSPQGSRVTGPVPAGAPYLRPEQLRWLFERAQVVER
jgi:hypothetical protein